MDVGPNVRWSVTASNRRLRELERRGRRRGRARVHDDDMHIAMDDDPIHGAPVMDDIAMDDDPTGDDVDIVDEDILTQPFLGGPTDPSILKSFKSHVAAAIWNGAYERGPLKCHNHSSKIRSWPWWEQGNNATFVNIVEMSELAQFARCTYRFVNKIVVSSFVERWQPETNTFHLTVREMTITLDNVTTILGFPIVGKSISVRKLSERRAIALVVNALEIDEQDVRHEICTAGGNSMRLEWLRTHFHNVIDNDSMERITCAVTRLVLGSPCLLSDLTTVSSYAWGAAVLTYLYRQMGYASRSGMKQIASYMTLLEGWVYENFRGF
ncbi:protein MAIN-LIKE 1-like [Camellia sinensis]|uniref:protein MAIN-LIKE 1-like n=1 Tax=Camellia sinensis TaxID=4442 RepID=UPI00103630D0|nr:protein MAIN-LIKE 1-like [Camellia sinensis]